MIDSISSTPNVPPSLSRILGTWVLQEIRLLFREPVAVFFSLAFPLILYVFIGSAYASEEISEGVLLIDIMYPALLGTVAANLALMGVPIYLVDLRSRKVLRYYATLPMPGWVFPVAVAISFLVLLVGAALILTAVVGISYSINTTTLISPLFLLTYALMLWWLLVFGFFLGSLPWKARTVQATATAIFFVMFFGSGVAAPLSGLPVWIEWLTRLNPLRHWFDVLIALYTGEPPVVDMSQWSKLLPVLVVVMILLPYTIRNFRRSDLS